MLGFRYASRGSHVFRCCYGSVAGEYSAVVGREDLGRGCAQGSQPVVAIQDASAWADWLQQRRNSFNAILVVREIKSVVRFISRFSDPPSEGIADPVDDLCRGY